MDKIEKLKNSQIQHGKANDRIYLMHFADQDFPDILNDLNQLAEQEHYGKIFAKVHNRFVPAFLAEGYEVEAYIPGFYQLKEDAVFLGKFCNKTRGQTPQEQLTRLQKLIAKLRQPPKKIEQGFELHPLTEADAPAAADIYKQVFETYPFPIHNPQWIVDTMKSHVKYFGVWTNSRLVGLSSAEISSKEGNAEMTDFAVLPEFRGKHLAYFLLERMELEMKAMQIPTLFTIARLASPGMNATFLQQQYRYSGTLVNNTQISGQLESMNVLYKHIC